jgi:hypothetical protein
MRNHISPGLCCYMLVMLLFPMLHILPDGAFQHSPGELGTVDNQCDCFLFNLFLQVNPSFLRYIGSEIRENNFSPTW